MGMKSGTGESLGVDFTKKPTLLERINRDLRLMDEDQLIEPEAAIQGEEQLLECEVSMEAKRLCTQVLWWMNERSKILQNANSSADELLTASKALFEADKWRVLLQEQLQEEFGGGKLDTRFALCKGWRVVRLD